MDVRRASPDVELDELITESLLYRMAAIHRIIDSNDWSSTSTVVLDSATYEVASPVPWDSSVQVSSAATLSQN